MNIFDIQEDLQALIDTIEANGGEVDEELSNQFDVTTNDFKEKCLSYAEVIQTLNNDLALIKEEKARLDRVKKQKEKSIEFLNNTLVAAIERFGTVDKKGKHFIDYGTKKLSIKETKAVETNDSFIETVVHNLKADLGYNKINNTLHIADTIDKEAFMDECRNTYWEEANDEQDIREADLDNLLVTTQVTIPLSSIFDVKGYKFVADCVSISPMYDFKGSISKSDIKGIIENNVPTNLGKIVINKKVNIE